jgi:hypothetical protein
MSLKMRNGTDLSLGIGTMLSLIILIIRRLSIWLVLRRIALTVVSIPLLLLVCAVVIVAVTLIMALAVIVLRRHVNFRYDFYPE